MPPPTLLLYPAFTFFSILGVLARVGLSSLTVFSGAYLGGLVWANFASCIITGLFTFSLGVWANAAGGKSLLALYLGVTTGFCGTLSSFLALILKVFLETSDVQPPLVLPHPAFGVMQFFAVSISQMALSMAGLVFGRHLAVGLEATGAKLPLLRFLEWLIAFLGVLSYAAVLALTIRVPNSRQWVFSCLFAPFACVLRYHLSRWNAPASAFPLGTFTANMLATAILSVTTLLSKGKTAHGRLVLTVLQCQVLKAIGDGFCGTLSTVSTFTVEIYKLAGSNGLDKAYRYAGGSLLAGFGLVVVILGTFSWTHGLSSPLCEV